MRTCILVIWFFPLIAFCIAAVAELRSQITHLHKFRNLIPLALGVISFGLSIHPGRLLSLTPISSVTLSRIMTFSSAGIACSGVFLNYSRRSSGIWVASGGLVLVLIWIFDIVRT
jgi:hypothetical protein